MICNLAAPRAELLWVAPARPPPLKPDLAIRTGQKSLLRPRARGRRTFRGGIHYRAHLVEPPRRPGECRSRRPTAFRAAHRSPAEFELLVVRFGIVVIIGLSFTGINLAGGQTKPSEQKIPKNVQPVFQTGILVRSQTGRTRGFPLKSQSCRIHLKALRPHPSPSSRRCPFEEALQKLETIVKAMESGICR